MTRVPDTPPLARGTPHADTSLVRIPLVIVVAGLLAAGLLAGTAMPAGAAPATGNVASKITICHRTASETNPFVRIVVDGSSLAGHGDHAGDIIPAPPSGCPQAPPPDDCDAAGLPCDSIPAVRSHWWTLAALLGGIGAYLALYVLVRRTCASGDDAC